MFAQVFTGAFLTSYRAPEGFCYDTIHCTDAPIQDDPRLEDYNVDTIVDLFVDK